MIPTVPGELWANSKVPRLRRSTAIELVPGATWTPELEAEVVAMCRADLAGFKLPRSFDVIEAMPRSAAGKLLKRRLREPYWEETGRRI